MARVHVTLTLLALAGVAVWVSPRLMVWGPPAPTPTPPPTTPSPPDVVAGRALAIVLDTSGSMADRDKLSHAKHAVRRAVAGMSPSDSFTLVTYGDRATRVFGPTSVLPPDDLADLLGDVHGSGSSNLYAGLDLAVRAAPPGATLLVISDGPPNAGVTDPGRLHAVASAHRASGGVVSTLALGLDGADHLRALAHAGGGHHEVVARPRDLPDVFQASLAPTGSGSASSPWRKP